MVSTSISPIPSGAQRRVVVAEVPAGGPRDGRGAGQGPVERIGEDGQRVADHHGRRSARCPTALADAGVDLATAGLRAVGHRVVHGGPDFSDPVIINDDVVAEIGD